MGILRDIKSMEFRRLVTDAFEEAHKGLAYRCLNGARHSYICCDTCWNHHPKHKKGKDYRLQVNSEYPCKTSEGIWSI